MQSDSIKKSEHEDVESPSVTVEPTNEIQQCWECEGAGVIHVWRGPDVPLREKDCPTCGGNGGYPAALNATKEAN